MTFLEFFILLIIAGICGSIGQAIAGYNRGGCLVSIALGFIGALLGSWMSGQFGLPELFNVTVGGNDFPVIWSIIGAVVFVAAVGFITKGRKRSF